MELNKIYNNLTNVQIEEQMRLWDERGKGYYGEYIVFTTLYKNIYGNCKFLMNLNVPTKNNKTTEVDLVLLHETGIYVFEIKHYKGTIYGNSSDKTWTQYFRTTSNSRFNSPVLQNNYHIEAIKNIFPEVPIHSVIVFTNPECVVKVNNNDSSILITNINDLVYKLRSYFTSDKYLYTADEVDSMFNKLAKYSNIQEPVIYNGKEEPFSYWISCIVDDYNNQLNIINNKIEIVKEDYKKRTIACIGISCFVIFISLFMAFAFKFNYDSKLKEAENNYNKKIALFEQKFKHIDQIDNLYINNLNQYFFASNVSINPLGNDSSTFTAKINKASNNNTYGMVLTENSKYIVMKNDGNVFEYDVFGKHLTYNRYYNMIGQGIRNEGKLAEIQFLGVLPNDINYIKLTGIQLIKLDTMKTVIKEDLELELYKK